MKKAFFSIVISLFLGFAICSASASSSMLDEINSRIMQSPDDPKSYDAKAVLLMELGRYDEGYEAAGQAMAAHIKAGDSVTWLALERIEIGDFTVTAGFNMGPAERNQPETGITRPLTFHLFRKDAVPIVGTVDYEIGMIDGKPASAAFRERDGKTYLNIDFAYNTLSTYKNIRQIAIELIKATIPRRELPGDMKRTI